MEGARHGESDNHVEPPVCSRVDAAEDDPAEPSPEKGDADEFQYAEFKQRRSSTRPAGQEERVREGKEVETGEAHDEVVELVPVAPEVVRRRRIRAGVIRATFKNLLVREEKLGEAVKGDEAVVVRRPDRVEEAGRDGKEGQMLDVGVVLRRIRHNCSSVNVRCDATSVGGRKFDSR